MEAKHAHCTALTQKRGHAAAMGETALKPRDVNHAHLDSLVAKVALGPEVVIAVCGAHSHNDWAADGGGQVLHVVGVIPIIASGGNKQGPVGLC